MSSETAIEVKNQSEGQITVPAFRSFYEAADVKGRADLQLQIDDPEQDTLTLDVNIASDAPIVRGGMEEILNVDGANLEWAQSGNAAMQGYSHEGVERFGARGHVGNFDNARVISGPGGRKRIRVRAIFYRNCEASMEMARQIAMGKMRNVSVEYKPEPGEGSVDISREVNPQGDQFVRVVFNRWLLTGFAWITNPADRFNTGLFRGDQHTLSFSTPTQGDTAMPNQTTPNENQVTPAAAATTPAVTPEVAVASTRTDTPAPAPAPEVSPAKPLTEGARSEVQAKGVDYVQINDFMKRTAALDENARDELWSACHANGWNGAQMSEAVLARAAKAAVPKTEGERTFTSQVNIIRNTGDNYAVARTFADIQERGACGRVSLTEDMIQADPFFRAEVNRILRASRASETPNDITNNTGLADDDITNNIIPALFQNTTFLRMIRMWPGELGRNMIVPVQTGDFSSRWLSVRDGQTTNATPTNSPTVDQKRNLECHIHQFIVNSDRDLFRQIPAYGTMLAEQLVNRLPAEVEREVITGNGSGGNLTGLVALASDVTSTPPYGIDLPAGTAYASNNAGGLLSLTVMNKLMEEQENRNLEQVGEPIYLTSTALKFRGMEIQYFSGTNGRALFQMSPDGMARFNGVPVMKTNYFPQFNGNKVIQTSTSSSNLHGMLCLRPADFWLGRFGGLDVWVDATSENLRKTGRVEHQFEQGIGFIPAHDRGAVGTFDIKNAVA